MASSPDAPVTTHATLSAAVRAPRATVATVNMRWMSSGVAVAELHDRIEAEVKRRHSTVGGDPQDDRTRGRVPGPATLRDERRGSGR